MKKRVTYFFKEDVGSYYYGPGHPMKPHRLNLTHHLILGYGLYRDMTVVRPHNATASELEAFHAPDYVNFLKRYSPKTEQELEKQMTKFNCGHFTDCPLFDGLYEFMSTCAGGSLEAAALINAKETDICVNWTGGLHHAKKGEASGFCYVNDIVLCILELLRVHERVLYVDIDIHHGDGVEEAFYTTDRVMTCSFHKYGEFFPGSGDINEIGAKSGKNYSVNFPLKEGLNDEAFEYIYKPVIDKIMEVYDPKVVVMCCGADSIAGDRLGCWNLSLEGHAGAIEYLKRFNIPMVLLGGGGYTPRNVARCWTYETALAVGKNKELDNELPETIYSHCFKNDKNLILQTDSEMKNANDREYLDAGLTFIMDQLKRITHVPSVSMMDDQNNVDQSLVHLDRFKQRIEAMEEKSDEASERELKRALEERRIEHQNELYQHDKDNKGESSAPNIIQQTQPNFTATVDTSDKNSPPNGVDVNQNKRNSNNQGINSTSIPLTTTNGSSSEANGMSTSNAEVANKRPRLSNDN